MYEAQVFLHLCLLSFDVIQTKIDRTIYNNYVLHYDLNCRPFGSVGRAPDYCAAGLGFEPQARPTISVLK